MFYQQWQRCPTWLGCPVDALVICKTRDSYPGVRLAFDASIPDICHIFHAPFSSKRLEMWLVFNTAQQQQNPLTLGRFEWKSIGIEVYGKKPEIWAFIWSTRLPPSQGGIRPHLKSGSHRLTQRILVFTILFGLYLETWVHCWCHGFLGVVMFLWWFHVVLLGICKRILKKTLYSD